MAITATPETQAERILDWATTTYRDRIVLACSFGGASGMVLVDLLARRKRNVPVYYLDTGVLFEETYALVDRVRERYGIEPLPVRSQLTLDAQAREHGEALWERDPDACCAVRKVEPQRAFLAQYGAWITGIRRDQSQTRAQASYVEWDPNESGLAKIAPLVDWTERDVWTYIHRFDVPYNPLLDQGYPSIGCAPCTRRVEPDADARSGRWSGFAKTECGLHVPGSEKA